jgi:organic hydroperoxide reductase OsmC/OhrA
MTEHRYELVVTWDGNRGPGTATYTGYGREHTVAAAGRPVIAGSSDPGFRGDPARWNPEQLFVASLAQCHMLWFLHLCADAGVVVTEYVDEPVGTMRTGAGGGGRFTDVLLRPRVVVAAADQCEEAAALHDRAHELCFIAQSVSCPVRHEPTVRSTSG